MAQTQKTIRFNGLTETLIRQISPAGEPNYNFSVNQIARRYHEMCVNTALPFTEKEKLAICQAYNGHFFNADPLLEAKSFRWQMVEAIKYDQNVCELLGDYTKQSAESWPEFMAKVDALKIPEIIALFQVIHEFWDKGFGTISDDSSASDIDSD